MAGIDFFGILDWTWGEVQEYVKCYYDRERRHNQHLAYIATRHAALVCRILAKGGSIDTVKEFPLFWTQEERRDAFINRLKSSHKR